MGSAQKSIPWQKSNYDAAIGWFGDRARADWKRLSGPLDIKHSRL